MESLKRKRVAAGLSQQAMSDILQIPKRTLENWETCSRIPPDYVKAFITQNLNKILDEQKGAIFMKKITIFEYQFNRHNGDSFSEYAYSLEEIQNIARKDGYTLTDSEKRNSDRYILGHDLIFDSDAEIPEKAEQLDTALHNGDIEAEGFDICIGYTDNNQSYFEEINE